MKSLISFVVFLAITCNLFPQSPDWSAIKSHAQPKIADTINYDAAYIQPHHNLGWEDGVFMSRDGRSMYAFYFPADLILFFNFLSLNPICPPIHPYIRGPLLGIDTITNPFGCTSLLHSDIIYATRSDTSLPFENWQPSNLANPVEFEGAPQTVQHPDGSLEFFVYTQSSNGQTDIYWLRDTTDNPNGPGTLIPDSVNSPSFHEDNPHLERINDSTLVLFLDNHADPADDADIYYTISYNNGRTWASKSLVSTVNTAEEDIQPHLWFDGIDWWLYFASPDPNDSFNRLSIFRMKQSIPNDWNSWINRELVISPGIITDGSGAAIAVGEPTLTDWGDISFVLSIQALGTSDTTDQFELDPWYLPRKTPILTSIKEETNQNKLAIFPNPVSNTLSISIEEDGLLSIYNIDGKLILQNFKLTKGLNQPSLDLSPQIYLFQVRTNSFIAIEKVIVK